jgi:DNA polymerase-3 subunit epsilon
MTKLLVTDVETTGVIPRGMTFEHPQMPRMVQIACVLLDNGVERAAVSLIVRPDVAIPEGASNVHGITPPIADEFGVTQRTAVSMFLRLLRSADIVCAFNASFDLAVIRGAAHREGVPWVEKPVRCAMVAATPICMMPPTAKMLAAGFNKPKPPKLEEAYEHLTGKKMVGAHDALVDVRACIEVHAKLDLLGCWRAAA